MLEFQLKSYCRSALPLAVWDERGALGHHPVHMHDCIEMVFIYMGAGSCSVDGVHYPVLPGDIYIIPAGATHEYSSDPGLRFYNIMFDRTLFRADEVEIFERFEILHERNRKSAGMEPKYTFNPAGMEFMLDICRRIEREFVLKKEYFEYNARALFMEFLVYFIRHSDNARGVGALQNQRNLSRIFDYIARRYTEKITLQQLAAVTGNSPDYLGKQFKKLLGMNISDYICRYRVERARYELENSNDSIAEVAARSGFYDSSYFIKSFQRFCSVTPAQYRKERQMSE